MSGIEVVAAVSAIISAFHGGSELLKHIKAKRRKSRQAQQEFEEKQLQESLMSGEQQIGFRYAQDMKEFGDLMRVGDVIARDQLQHITIMMQGEVIKSLQMAVHFEHAVLNLALLHEASITNKQATFVIFDQLKQRLLPRMPISRQMLGQNESSSRRLLSSSSIGSNTFDPATCVPDNYIPLAVTLPNQQNVKGSKHGLSSYFKELEHDSGFQKPSLSSQSRQTGASDDINFSQAFQHLLNARGMEDRAVIMKEIDEIMDSYQGLQISSNDPWSHHQTSFGPDGRHDAPTMLNSGGPYAKDPSTPQREPLQMPKILPPTPEGIGHGNYQQRPTFNNGIFEQQKDQSGYPQHYPAKNPYPQIQTQSQQPRWSSTSGTSSNYSGTPSLDRNSSTSSQESRTQNQPVPLQHSPRNLSPSITLNSTSPDSPLLYYDPQFSVELPADLYTQPIAPLSPQNSRGQSSPPAYAGPQTSAHAPSPQHEDPNSLMFSPYAMPYQQAPTQSMPPFQSGQQHTYLPRQQEPGTVPQDQTKYHPMHSAPRDPSSQSSSERTLTQSVIAATALGTAPAVAGLRHASITPSIASTDSSNSIPIGILPSGPRMKSLRAETIQSAPAGQERMMSGRPCKANNYWGFCKGAWTTREDAKKGLSLRTQPLGMYNHQEIWECSSCTFKGNTFTAPHPTKKNKTITVVDPRVITSKSQIRYKWIFLAKSHIKKKANDSHTVESNYGCVFCSLEDRVSSVYGGVETLMNHIALSHVADMSENTRRKAKCVLGRQAGASEEWDINIPVFARVEEVA
ncbi:hypothetical protein DE146DRAFT_755450 [Phaeosphaeria sp. MPI-PUGE-AT-0046c]|nr:hypothetical protein DE146DRAFT_755450 [Phaeosphaeria sp. MPI-PUGE-AT-0046c]